MSGHNGSAAWLPRTVAKNAREIGHDVVSLVQLQLQLFENDCRESARNAVLPGSLILASAALAAGCVPIALAGAAELLIQSGGLSPPAAFAITALAGVILAGGCGFMGWLRLRRALRPFQHSCEEFNRNVAWIKDMLRRPHAAGAAADAARERERR